MLTYTGIRGRRTLKARAVGFLCEAVAYELPTGRTFWLSTYQATTPRLALRWLHHRARQIGEQLDPPQARHVGTWLADRPERERALDQLAAGGLYSHTLHEPPIHYLLTARPTGDQT
ncbi:hypothetical protein [Streptomyces profundus]|uniref:hypothetical protein n=1 Tax=Streptomyces profundus TaxID=2867410 RepID=UPI001D161E99|nr:hypothetical protein [Streptomyces sp. MA3_2.13]UED85205.1 hypothetical protein K4G22_14195 [Streptomyces sp. MA3_2.13]